MRKTQKKGARVERVVRKRGREQAALREAAVGVRHRRLLKVRLHQQDKRLGRAERDAVLFIVCFLEGGAMERLGLGECNASQNNRKNARVQYNNHANNNNQTKPNRQTCARRPPGAP